GKVGEFFEFYEVPEGLQQLKDVMQENKKSHVFGCYFQQRYFFLKLKDEYKPEDYISGNHSVEWKNLSLPILHDILLDQCLNVKNEDISYIKDTERGLKKVDEGKIKALFIVNPATLEEIQKITQLGEIMPQKSTYFYPKPLSGLIIHLHTEEIE
ncbi:MAG: hypothetical protein ACXAAI_13200, partial [Promethearchaeota archaeon]